MTCLFALEEVLSLILQLFDKLPQHDYELVILLLLLARRGAAPPAPAAPTPPPAPDLPFRPERLQGEIPNPADAPQGCRFHTRCPFARPRCAQEVPDWRELTSDHYVACHYAEEFDFRRARETAHTDPVKEREPT